MCFFRKDSLDVYEQISTYSLSLHLDNEMGKF